MLTTGEREELSKQMASVRSKMNHICDILSVELMETSIISDIALKQQREQTLVNNVRDLNKVIEYFVMNHKMYAISRGAGAE